MTHADTYANLLHRVRALMAVSDAYGGMPSALRAHYAELLSQLLTLALAGYRTDIVENRAVGVAKVFSAT